jgi:hypothetical protein
MGLHATVSSEPAGILQFGKELFGYEQSGNCVMEKTWARVKKTGLKITQFLDQIKRSL